MKYLQTTVMLLFFTIVSGQNKSKQDKIPLDTIQKLDEVIISTNAIFGNKYVAKNRTGSSYYISANELKKFNATDINRVLRSVPGVTFYEEDGFGLRPNISLRGTSPERSSKISIMEDGVLIAPAPYSAPAAYYFPSVARMQAVEILKGSSQVQYGPFTTGGAINFISSEIPESFKGFLKSSYGSFDTGQTIARIGDSKESVGYMVEFLNFNSNGFKNLANNSNTGFDKNDVVAKFRVNSKEKAKLKQAFEVKFQFSDEVSNETYLGLTEGDFITSPFDRYAASQKDRMVADHLQLLLTHTLNLSENFRITTNGYYNRFKRNWYKLDDVVFNNDKQSLATIVNTPELFPNHLNILKGEIDSDDSALLVKANNRKYISKGLQTKLDYHWYGDHTFHDIEVGIRYHYDEEDRFQWEDGYNMINGTMNLTFDGEEGTEANRISSARALASYVTYKFKYKNLTLTPGLRYENIILKRENFGTSDINRTGSELSTRENKVDILIPGIGFNYKISDNTSLFGGVHKGFSPPSNQEGQEAEESINYEFGTRFSLGQIKGEVVAFYNDYSNLLGSDLAATGGTGSLDQFNAGEVAVNGLEVLLNYDPLATYKNINLPISFGYTFTNTKFLNSFGSQDDLWGEVTRGDELTLHPYTSI